MLTNILLAVWSVPPVGNESRGDADQYLGELRKDPPIMRLVCIGQRRARPFAAEPHVIQLALESAQARLDIAQALAISELREGHRQ